MTASGFSSLLKRSPPWPGRNETGHFFSLAQDPQDHGNKGADEDHGGDGKVDLEVGPVDDDVTRQPPDRDLSQPGPEKPYDKNHDPDDDQRFLHGLSFFPFNLRRAPAESNRDKPGSSKTRIPDCQISCRISHFVRNDVLFNELVGCAAIGILTSSENL